MSCQQLRHEEIMPRLTKIVVEVLGVRPESVRSEANFWTDLGADSLDDYDLSMRCEREFDIKWGPFGALVELAPNGLQLDPNGFLNESFLEQWYCEYPFVREIVTTSGKPRSTPTDLQNLYTVDFMARLIEAELQR